MASNYFLFHADCLNLMGTLEHANYPVAYSLSGDCSSKLFRCIRHINAAFRIHYYEDL
jgi:hypothetical protein